MSLQGLLAQHRRWKYDSDRRPQPEEVEITTNNKEEVYAAIDNCVKQFKTERKINLCDTSRHAYAYGLTSLKENLIPRLSEKAGDRHIEYSFSCLPDYRASTHLSIKLQENLSVEIFSQFHDKFTPGICSGDAPGYVRQSIADSERIINSLKLE